MALNGGKHYLAKQIVAMQPTNCTHYVEPYAGSLAVLFARDPVGSEIVNDLHLELTNFWRVLADPETAQQFIRRIECVPFSEVEFEEKSIGVDLDRSNLVARAASFFVSCRQSMSGRMKNFAPVYPNRLRRGMHEGVSAWLSAVAGLPEVHERLKRVAIYNRDALEIIRQHDTPHTLFYCDPPYLLDTRVTKDAYEYEMTDNQHLAMLDTLRYLKGRFILSGYSNTMYRNFATWYNWNTVEIEVPNRAGDSSTRAVECIWRNYT